MAGEGMCGRGGHAWQERRPLQQTVRILLEYILVFDEDDLLCINCFWHWLKLSNVSATFTSLFGTTIYISMYIVDLE